MFLPGGIAPIICLIDLRTEMRWPWPITAVLSDEHATKHSDQNLDLRNEQWGSAKELLVVLQQIEVSTVYRITGIICGRKVSRILQIWKHSRMFSCAFYLGRNFYIIMRLPESRKFSRELRPRRQFAKLFFRG